MYKFIIILLLGIFIVGCASNKPITIVPHATQDKVNTILTSVEKIESVTSDASVISQTEIIKDSTKSIANDFKEYNSNLEKLIKDNEKLRDQTEQSFKKILLLIILISGMATGITGVLFVLGKLPSVMITSIAFAALVSAISLLTLIKYYLIISIVVGIIVLVIVGYAMWQVYNSKRANGELVQTVHKAILDGKLNFEELKEIADSIQSHPTQLIVKQFKEKLEQK